MGGKGSGSKPQPASRLTIKQTQIALMLARGETVTSIAFYTNSSQSNVGMVLKRARRVVGAKTNTQLAAMVAVAHSKRQEEIKAAEELKQQAVLQPALTGVLHQGKFIPDNRQIPWRTSN